MSQGETVGPIENSVGYVLKQAAVTLRSAMDEVLRPLQLTTPQYSCLEQLHQRPGLSNAALARGTFVTRQSMNVVLRGLEERGLVIRPPNAERGRELPAELTPAGHESLRAASVACRAVEKKMIADLSPAEQEMLLGALRSCIQSLTSIA
jgi:DNA-binding MarR family transcriptional regulator